MRMVRVIVDDINDKRIMSNTKAITSEMLEDVTYPEEFFYQLYIEAKVELEDRILDEEEEARRLRDER